MGLKARPFQSFVHGGQVLVAMLGGIALLTVAWSWYFRFEIRTGYEKGSDVFLMLPTPGLLIWLSSTGLIALLIGRLARHTAETEHNHYLVRWSTMLGYGALLLSVPFVVLPHIVSPASMIMGLLWHTYLPVIMLVITAGLAWLLAGAMPRQSKFPCLPHRRRTLIILFFVLVHLPSIWFAKPWESFFYRHRHLGGDEPRYLLLTHSLAQDQDFNIYNNLVNNHRDQYICWSNPFNDPGDAFYADRAKRQGAAPPHTEPEYWHQRRYGIERIGMPLLIAPAYQAGLKFFARHRYGVVTMLNLILVFSMLNIYQLAWRITHQRRAALMAAITGGLSGPMLFYGVAAYTEPVSAALLIFALRRIHEIAYPQDDENPNAWFKHVTLAMAIAYLPWVHEKMLMFSGVLVLMMLILARPPKRLWPVTLGILVLSALLQARYYWVLYGQFSPPPVHGLPFSFSKLWQEGLWGLLLDQKRGILPTAPWAFAGAAGLYVWVCRQRRFALWPLIMTTAFLIGTGCFGGWYGGTSAQPRYPVNIMPVLAVGLALAWTYIPSRGAKALILSTATIGIIQGVTAVFMPHFMAEHRAPFWRDIYPIVFLLNPVEIAAIAAWVMILIWGGMALANKRLARVLIFLPILGVFIIAGASGYRFTQAIRPQIAVWNRDYVMDHMRADQRFGTLNKRIVMARYQRLVAADPIDRMTLGAQIEAERLAANLNKPDKTASGQAVVDWTSVLENDWCPVMRSQSFSLYEGRYTALWRVRLPAESSPESSPPRRSIRIRAMAGMHVFNEIVIPLANHSQWQTIRLPFTLSEPRRGVVVRLSAHEINRLQIDTFGLEYVSE